MTRRHANGEELRLVMPGEMEDARAAADALERGLADFSARGEQSVILASSRPRWWHIYQWQALPGFRKTMSGSTRERKPPVVAFTHALLPGWEYTADELREMLDDLRNVAAGRGQPTAPTRGAIRKGPRDASHQSAR